LRSAAAILPCSGYPDSTSALMKDSSRTPGGSAFDAGLSGEVLIIRSEIQMLENNLHSSDYRANKSNPFLLSRPLAHRPGQSSPELIAFSSPADPQRRRQITEAISAAAGAFATHYTCTFGDAHRVVYGNAAKDLDELLNGDDCPASSSAFAVDRCESWSLTLI
jgi:hypothetical protein